MAFDSVHAKQVINRTKFKFIAKKKQINLQIEYFSC